MQALGLQLDGNVSHDIARALDVGETMLQQLTPAVLRTLHSPDGAVRLACVPFLSAHLARLKTQSKRSNGALPEAAQQGLHRLFEVCPCIHGLLLQ